MGWETLGEREKKAEKGRQISWGPSEIGRVGNDLIPLSHGTIQVPLAKAPLAKVPVVRGVTATWHAQIPAAVAQPSREKEKVLASEN